MARYVFRFAALLSYRKSRRDLCRSLLGQLLADQEKLSGKRQQIEQQREDQMTEIRELGDGGTVNIDRLATRRYYIGKLLGDLAQVDREQALLTQQLGLCRQALVEADRQVKVLEKLHEKQRAEFLYHENRKTENELQDAWQAVQLVETSR
jgi:flagellar protein FliJ